MNVLVFGASGATGREVLRQGLAQDHTVTAFVRNPAKLAIEHPNLRVYKGNVVHRATVESVIQGQDEVISVLGGSSLLKREPAIVIGLHNIILAMEQAGVRRLIYLSNDAVHDVLPQCSLLQRFIIVPILLRKVAADHELNEGMIKQSRLGWTIVRPGMLTNGKQTGSYRSGEHIRAKSIIPRISRADLAEFLLKQLTVDGFLRGAPVVMY